MSTESTNNKPGKPKDVGAEKELVTPDGEVIDNSLTGTMDIDPEAYQQYINTNRLSSVKFALAGLLYLLRREQSIQILGVLSVIVIVVGFWLGITRSEWVELVIALGIVWVTECLNTAVEAVVNIAAPDPHPMAKVSKDVASTATFLSVLVFVIIIGLVLGEPLIVRLTGT